MLAASDEGLRTPAPPAIQYRHVRKDGTVIWVHEEAVTIERDHQGRPTLAQGVMYDVTERKHAEQDLAQTEARYRTLVERVPAVTYTWDAVHRSGEAPAPYISPQVQELLGYSADEFGVLQLWADPGPRRRPGARPHRVGGMRGRRRDLPLRVPDADAGRDARCGSATRRSRSDATTRATRCSRG